MSNFRQIKIPQCFFNYAVLGLHSHFLLTFLIIIIAAEISGGGEAEKWILLYV
jgi:hypothetical protein